MSDEGGGDNKNDANFWESVAIPLRESFTMLDQFGALDKPEQKTREQVHKEGIDQTSTPSVAQLKERFSKGSPVFPRQVCQSKKTKKDDITAQKDEEQEDTGDSTIPDEHPAKEETTGVSTVEEKSPPKRKSTLGSGADDLTPAEFSDLAKLHNCQSAIDRFTIPSAVEVAIKSEDGPFLIKQMKLQFNASQRLLVMIRHSKYNDCRRAIKYRWEAGLKLV